MALAYQRLTPGATAVFFLGFSLWPVEMTAQTSAICVTCTGPEHTYRCELTGEDVPSDRRIRGFYCAASLAEEHAHHSCAVMRQQKQCPGTKRSFVYDPEKPVLKSVTRAEEGAQQKRSPAQESQTPKTVEELTRETARRTSETLDTAADQTVETTRTLSERVQDAVSGAADAVSRAAQGTARCVGSWFRDC